MNKTEAAVARGAALLDERCPDWDRYIQLINLDMGHTDTCVLGQVFGDYEHGEDLLYAGKNELERIISATRDGFNISTWVIFMPWSINNKYAELDFYWRKAVLDRRMVTWKQECRAEMAKAR